MTLSVVIPTKDRAETLRRNLERLRRQVPPPGGFEVVVVDNGSTDDTATVLERAVEGFGGQLVVVAEPKPGPASARNAGVRASSGALILFMGDDMLPAGDDLLLRHAQLHEDDPDPTYAILGRVEWVAEPTVTPFMRWLDRGGPQFAFFRFEPGVVDARGYFYTSQVSLKKALFESVGGFDERFPYAALEDVDLGVRLADAGLRLEYHPELLVYHDHPTTTRAAAERARLVGRSAALYAELHPERPLPGFEPLPRLRSAIYRVAGPWLRVLAQRRLPHVSSVVSGGPWSWCRSTRATVRQAGEPSTNLLALRWAADGRRLTPGRALPTRGGRVSTLSAARDDSAVHRPPVNCVASTL